MINDETPRTRPKSRISAAPRIRRNRRIRRRRTPYVTWQTLTLIAIQVLPLFLLPYILLPWAGHNGWFDTGLGRNIADAFFPVTEWDPHGREYWRADVLNPQNNRNYRIVASPTIVDDLIIAPTRERPMLAIRAGGRGDVTKSHVLWRFGNGPDVPTPVTDETPLVTAIEAFVTLENQDAELVDHVLQAMDAGGKDGAVRRVFSGVNDARLHPKRAGGAHPRPAPDEGCQMAARPVTCRSRARCSSTSTIYWTSRGSKREDTPSPTSGRTSLG